ncbi:MAG: ribonuclease H-like domain-containing protein [Candidatus Dojkabacteria bacterium]
MSRVVFDIETIGFNLDGELFDDKQKEYLLKYATNEDEITAIHEGMGFHPLTGKIVCIGMYNPDSGKGCAYFETGNENEIDEEIDGIYYKSCTEQEILERFWEDICKYTSYITFNGRGFDVPFIRIRSAILGLKCSRELHTPRFDSKTHIDLLEELTFQGAFFRKFNLDFYCKAFGIESPKEGMCGHEVPVYYKDGRGLEIAEYCVGDVIATGKLFLKWVESYNRHGY